MNLPPKLLPILLAVLPWLCGFTPYEHEGSAAVVVDGTVARGRALFSSEAASATNRVLVYTDFRLGGGVEGYLTIDLTLGAAGATVPAVFTYYEKRSANEISFDGGDVTGSVLIGDRFEYGDETSLYLEFNAQFARGAAGTRTLRSGWAVTAPSPSILRDKGLLPNGMVVVDDGSGTYTGRAYDRGSVDCYGYPTEVVLVESYHDDYYVVDDLTGGSTDDYVIIDPVEGSDPDPVDPGVVYEPAADGGYDSYSESPSCDNGNTTDSSDSSSGDAPSCKDSSSSDSSSSSSGSGCTGDAVAASGTHRFVRFHRGPPLWARRVLQVSPFLLALAALLFAREWPWRRRSAHR